MSGLGDALLNALKRKLRYHEGDATESMSRLGEALRNAIPFGTAQELDRAAQMRMQPGSLRPSLTNEQMAQEGLNIVGMAPIGMTVYHGSPHKFDKFDMSKIGTGEGAQAYGHGLYVAESPEIAEHYLEKLGSRGNGGRNIVAVDAEGNQIEGFIDKNDLWSGNALYNPLLDKRIGPGVFLQKTDAEVKRQALKEINRLPSSARSAASEKMQEALDRGIRYKPAGSFYKADIPDEALPRMLDWDKPLSEQAPEVQAAFAAANEKVRGFVPEDITRIYGAELKSLIAGRGPEYTQALKELGIPGIRYLDGGSRGAGEGTSNFVLFDDQLPRILERNGVPTGLEPWKPGEANELLGITQSRPALPMKRDSADLLAGLGPVLAPLGATALGAALFANSQDSMAGQR